MQATLMSCKLLLGTTCKLEGMSDRRKLVLLDMVCEQPQLSRQVLAVGVNHKTWLWSGQ